MIITFCLHDEEWVQLSSVSDNIRNWYYVSSYGRVFNKHSNAFIKPFVDSRGYMCVNLQMPLVGKQRKYYVHRLVALAFIPNDDTINKTQVNHLNGIKNKNYKENLEWSIPIDNISHSITHGLRENLYGEKHHKNIYTEEFIHNICKLISQGYKPREICKELEIMSEDKAKIKRLIKHIKRKEQWTHVSKLYNI